MSWGEIQSVIQLVAALNAIYISLLEIRNPYVRSEEKALSLLSSAIIERNKGADESEKANLRNITTSYNDVRTRYSTAIATFDKTDSWIGIACAITVFIYIILLIISSFCYQSQICTICALVICIVGFIPITVGFFLNIRLIRTIKQIVTKERIEIEARMIQKP